MRVITGTVSDGKIEIPADSVSEGSRVMVLALEPGPVGTSRGDEEGELFEAMQQIGRHEFAAGKSLVGVLRSRIAELLHQPPDRRAEADPGERLKAVFQAMPALEAETKSLELLDDAALWNAARTEMPQSDAERMEELHRKQRLTGLSAAEGEELSRLERQYERVILVRSHSAWLLQQRGHDIGSLTGTS